MNQITIDFTCAQMKALNELSKAYEISCADLICEAVDILIATKRHESKTPFPDVFGLWTARGLDALSYEQEVRCEW